MTNEQLLLFLRGLIARLRGVVDEIDDLDNPGERALVPMWINEEKQAPPITDNEVLLHLHGYVKGIDFELQPNGMSAAALVLDDWLDELAGEINEALDG